MSKANFAASCARAVERLERDVFHKNAGNFPGVVAKKLDSTVLGHLASKIENTAIVISATNGKTTSTNMLADCLAATGARVFCNRDGANLETGIITTLLPRSIAPYAVFECDELYTRFVLPQVKPAYFMLLNLFPDQVDRFGGIDRIQDVLVDALTHTPDTVLVYNADDPYCQAVARRVSNATVAFGMAYDQTPAVEEALVCSTCGKAELHYDTHVYGQLGTYTCPACGEHRVEPTYEAVDITETATGYTLRMTHEGQTVGHLSVPSQGLYMVYNVLAVAVMAQLMGVSLDQVQACVNAFNPRNGRLQSYDVYGYDVVSNLAKNPVGFNQNIDLLHKAQHLYAVSFMVNNNESDGRDIAWLDDVHFEELAAAAQAGVRVFAGGMVTDTLVARLQKAGIQAEIAQNAGEVFAALGAAPHAATSKAGAGAEESAATQEPLQVFFIANYTALPPVHQELENLEMGA